MVSLFVKEHKTLEEICRETGLDFHLVGKWLLSKDNEIPEDKKREIEEDVRKMYRKDTTKDLLIQNKELRERVKVLEDNVKYLTELLNILKENQTNNN